MKLVVSKVSVYIGVCSNSSVEKLMRLGIIVFMKCSGDMLLVRL